MSFKQCSIVTMLFFLCKIIYDIGNVLIWNMRYSINKSLHLLSTGISFLKLINLLIGCSIILYYRVDWKFSVSRRACIAGKVNYMIFPTAARILESYLIRLSTSLSFNKFWVLFSSSFYLNPVGSHLWWQYIYPHSLIFNKKMSRYFY